MSIPQCNWRLSRATAGVAAAVTLVSTFVPRLSSSEEAAAAVGARPIIAIEGVSVVDVLSGTLLDARTVLIVDGRIAATAAATAVDVPPVAVRIDGRGRYLIPGLVDMHVHLFNNFTHRAPNEWAFPLFVANGVTGVREMQSVPADMPSLTRWRAGVARGDLIAPHVLAAGVSVADDSVASTRRQVREAHAAGLDFVKIFSGVTELHWGAILEEARALQMPVCGHVPAAVTLLDAARAGQRSNEHLTQVYEACSAMEQQLVRGREARGRTETVKVREGQEREVLESFDQLICDRIATALATSGQVQVPTLVLPHFEARGPRTDFWDDARWAYLRVDEQARWERFRKEQPANDEALAAQRLEVSRRIVMTLHAAGVRILAGTDAPMPLVYPGFALHEELQLLADAGLSAADALRAATIWPAEFLGQSDSSGSVAVGKRADLVLLDENPLSDISNTQRIRAVVLDGRLFRRADLDALLRDARSTQ